MGGTEQQVRIAYFLAYCVLRIAIIAIGMEGAVAKVILQYAI
jgi:hypothetical protein